MVHTTSLKVTEEAPAASLERRPKARDTKEDRLRPFRLQNRSLPISTVRSIMLQVICEESQWFIETTPKPIFDV